MFTGQNQGSVSEDSLLVTSGTLTISDRDAGESGVQADSAPGTFGSFSINTQGEWSYTLHNGSDVVQALGGGWAATESFEVQSIDGTTHRVDVDVYGANGAPSGGVTVSGQPIQGQTLSVDISALDDEEGIGALDYQWLLDGVPISGAEQASYVLSQDEVGGLVSVRVSYTDGAGATESLLSSAVLIENVNDSPTGTLVLAGVAEQGGTLFASESIADQDGLGTFSYHWLRDGVPIDGATSALYTLTQSDVGSAISVVISYTDGQGEGEEVVSSELRVANVNDLPAGSVAISGDPLEGERLSAQVSLTDLDGLGAFSYQWLRSGSAIEGENGSVYVPVQADVGESISVRVEYTDQFGTEERVESAAVTVANVNDSPEGAVTINGSAIQGEVLTAVPSISDEDGIGALNYQWLLDGAPINGATASVYSLSQSDVSAQISVRVAYVDGQGTQEQLESNALLIANINDSPSGEPVIEGSAEEDSVLSVALGGIDDADGLGTFDFQWFKDGALVSTDSTYLLTQADVGCDISVEVSYVDGFGQSEFLLSSAVGPVANRNDNPVGSVVLQGIASSGEVISATPELSDEDGVGDYSYQWLLDGVVIGGETSSTLALTDEYINGQVWVEVSYVDGETTLETVVSGHLEVRSSAVVIDDDAFLWDSTIQTPEGEIVSAPEAQLYRSYYGALGRLPDGGGYDWWLNEIEQGRHTLTSMAAGFIYSVEFRDLADQDGSGAVSNAELIEHIYTGVFGRSPDIGGFNWWLDLLDRGSKSQEQVFIDMTQSNEYVELTVNIVAEMQFI